jgi:hypothetical protein
VAFLACLAMVFLPMACANGALPGLLRAALAAFSSREAWDSLEVDDLLGMAAVYRQEVARTIHDGLCHNSGVRRKHPR